VASPEGNSFPPPVDTHSLSVQQYMEQVPLLLDGRGAPQHNLRRFVVYLATFASQDGTDIFPSVDRVARHMHVTRRTVFNLYRRAEQAKLIIRDGHSSKGTIRCRLNLELPCAEGWLPYDAAAEHRREKQREYTRRWRAKAAGGETKPLTDDTGGETKCLTSVSGEGDDFTQPSIPEHQVKEELHSSTAVAAAPTASQDEILEAELIDEPPNLPAVRADVVPAVPNLSSSWLLPEELPKGRKPAADAMRFEASPWPVPQTPRTPSAWTKELMGYWVERCREHGFEPSSRQCGQAGKEIKALVWAGNNPNHVAKAAERAAQRDGAWITRAMSEVRPGGWAGARGGRQVVTSQGLVELPAGATANMARSVTIRDLLGTS